MLLFFVMTAIVGIVPVYLEAPQSYCDLCSEHTMCLYKGISSKCGEIYNLGVNSDQSKKIVEQHNKLRNKVAQGKEQQGSNGPQPRASDMSKLDWSSQLASIAQRWADQCQYEHDTCRKTRTFQWVGQNIALKTSGPCKKLPSADWNIPISSWYDEVKFFDKDIVRQYRETEVETGHYTQIVWANTTMVGCGFSAFFSKEDGNQMCNEYYVCDYGMGGNIKDKPVYDEGTPRSSCKTKSVQDRRYPALC